MHYRLRTRSPRLTLAFWIFALISWIYSLLTGATAHAAETTSPLPDLYWVVVDRSASMGPGIGNNNLVGAATEKLHEFIAGLEPNTRIRIVFFASQIGKTSRWSSLTPEVKEDIYRWIAAEFHPSDGTRLFDTVGSVLAELQSEREQFGRTGLLVFSDGEDNESTRFKSWGEIERTSGNLVAQFPATFMRLYSLGKEPRSKPSTPWVVQEAPTAADLRKVVIEPAPEARLKIIPETLTVGQDATFVVLLGRGRIASVAWDFGDGANSSESAPSHSYSTDGVFNGSLTVTGPGGTDTKAFAVTVAKRAPLSAAFSWAPKSVRAGEPIDFIDESSGGAEMRRWSVNGRPVGEGSRYSWRSQSAGAAIVRLEITRGAETTHVEHSINVRPPKLDASFTVLPSHSVVLGAELSLKASESDPTASHEWMVGTTKIGDAPTLKWKPAVAILTEIVHRVTRGDESESATDRVQIVTRPPPAEFTITPALEVDLGQEVSVTARNTDPTWRHSYKFSTGEIFETASVSLPMTKLGRVEITHVIDSPSGRSEARETILVRDAVTADFTINATRKIAPAEVKFEARSQHGILSREWAFGDGITSSEKSPSHVYSASGAYRPVLKVRDVAGREHTYQLPDAIVVSSPRSWWFPWAITGGILIAIGAATTAVARDRRRLIDLEGRLEWQFGANRGRVELCGREFDLQSLNIPGWNPRSVYTVVRRKAAGHQLLRDGAADQVFEQDISLEIEGARLRLVP